MNLSQQPWPAPAKINLFLHITARRDDGYHLLQTAFQFLDYCDYLRFDIRDDQQIRRSTDIEAVAEADDICIKAAHCLRDAAGVKAGVSIAIDKRIPMGGGLGGGSSDAATTLIALNHLWQLGFSIDRLAALGLQLGADVPVFIRGHAAWAEGVGEQLTPIELAEPWYLVLKPPVNVSTAKIFNATELTRNCPPIKIRHLLAGDCSNVCEPVVRSAYPEVDQALRWIAEHTPARMTGTGACVFGCFDTQAAAQQALQALQKQMPADWLGFVASGLNKSPLQIFADNL